jgi:hypothetical protein
MNIGIIAEDDSDVEVISSITLTLLRPRIVGFKKFVGGGCGKVRRKCAAWARNLVQQGCLWIVVVHDLDENNAVELRNQLTAAILPSGAHMSVVLIPKREIEAWLLYDARAIAIALRERTHPPLPGNPEHLRDPKSHLCNLVWKKYRKIYLHTTHNGRIAKQIDTALLRGSPSFSPHFEFAARVRPLVR